MWKDPLIAAPAVSVEKVAVFRISMNDLFATVESPVVLIVGVTDTSVKTFALSPASKSAIAAAS